jgi:hypothetical protein
MKLTPLKTSRDLFLNATYFSNFCVLVQAVRQAPSPSDLPTAGKDAFDAAKDQAKQKAKETSSKVPKPRSGRR